MNNFAKIIDHTLIKPETTQKQITKLCEEAQQYGFGAVCVLPYYVSYSAGILKNSEVNLCTVAGFPLGASKTEIKLAEVKNSIGDGANEIDMVLNIAALKNKEYTYIQEEIFHIAVFCHQNNCILKVIIETCLLTNSEKIKVCEIVSESGADYIKTSTGFSGGGATNEDVLLIKNHISNNLKIKASAGIKTAKFALELVQSGASRIGTSSGVNIMKELSWK